MDELNEELPRLTSFVLPGGGIVAAHLHLARTVCRRAERLAVALHREEPLSGQVIPYVNRLSDHLFVLARWSALKSGQGEQLWDPQRQR
jgi:cob(I)alamin adenosyltransferase